MKLELVEAHHIRRDGMKFSLLVSVCIDDPIFANQVSERFGITRLKKLAFILHDEAVEGWISRYNGPFTEQTAAKYVAIPVDNPTWKLITRSCYKEWNGME